MGVERFALSHLVKRPKEGSLLIFGVRMCALLSRACLRVSVEA